MVFDPSLNSGFADAVGVANDKDVLETYSYGLENTAQRVTRKDLHLRLVSL